MSQLISLMLGVLVVLFAISWMIGGKSASHRMAVWMFKGIRRCLLLLVFLVGRTALWLSRIVTGRIAHRRRESDVR